MPPFSDPILLVARHGAPFQALVEQAWQESRATGLLLDRPTVETLLWRQLTALVHDALTHPAPRTVWRLRQEHIRRLAQSHGLLDESNESEDV